MYIKNINNLLQEDENEEIMDNYQEETVKIIDRNLNYILKNFDNQDMVI